MTTFEGGEGVRVERSGTRHCNGAGTRSGAGPVTLVARDGDWDSQALHKPAHDTLALAVSPGDRACAITSNSRLRELNSLREFRLRNSVPALAREPALR
ncbi:hypothetical protein, partial [Streptomyces sp. NPDC088727]|uniref:hypothetical protein n=1 Tax=Streptomyces sp. NPDC088727 TaxID=3365875 RepID=UPI003807F8AD